MLELNEQSIESLREKGKKSLFFFAKAILGFDKLNQRIHLPIAKELEDYTKNLRIVVVLPRDWYKTTLVSIAYPLWRAINNPNIRMLIVQNSYSNACKKLGAIKQVVESNDLFRMLYPEILPDSSCVWSKECLTLKRAGKFPEGTFEAAGTGTAVTGRHYDLIIEDDTVSPDLDAMTGISMQPTQSEIDKAIGWHRLAHPLLIEMKESQIIVVGTRWSESDLIGWILQNSVKDYKVLSRAVKEDKFGNSSRDGELVWPERFDEAVLSQLESDLGPYMTASLYYNQPQAAVNQVFKRDWIRYYLSKPDGLVCCTSVDPAPSDKEEASDPDYSVVMTTGVNPIDGRIYVLDYFRGRVNPGELIRIIFDHYRIYSPVVVKVESIAYQRTLAYWINRKQESLRLFFTVEEIRSARASKVDRIRGLQPFFASGKIAIRAEMSDLERELLAFPKAAHDDLPDALSMQIGFWNETTSSGKKAVENTNMWDENSLDYQIDRLMKRSKNMKKYPYDIGLMSERLQPLRNYAV